MIELRIDKKIKTYKGVSRLLVNDYFPEFSVTKVYGPSGIGKTTFLKIIAGLITPENGLIKVKEQCWLDTQNGIDLPAQERKTGFVFQDYALFPNMSTIEHLQYATDDSNLVERLLQMGQMKSYANQRPQNLSGGQQQRLAILRALALKPKLMLMDEPFSAMDDLLREEIIANLKILLKEFGTTTLIVSHHAQDTIGFADRSLEISMED